MISSIYIHIPIHLSALSNSILLMQPNLKFYFAHSHFLQSFSQIKSTSFDIIRCHDNTSSVNVPLPLPVIISLTQRKEIGTNTSYFSWFLLIHFNCLFTINIIKKIEYYYLFILSMYIYSGSDWFLNENYPIK